MSITSPERKLLHLALLLSLVSAAVAGVALGLSLRATPIARSHTRGGGQVAERGPAAGLAAQHDERDLAPGVRVVARWQDAFWEATVVAAQGDLITVAWDQPPPELSYRPRGWVGRMDETVATAAVGDWLLCLGSGRAWHLCQVEVVEGERLGLVSSTDARAFGIAREDTLPVPPGLASWAARHGTATLAAARLVTRLQDVQPATAGKPARAGDRVLARWSDGAWWEAEVEAVAAAEVVVAWADGSAPTGVAPAQVAPLGDAPRASKRGELALCKWGQSTRWWAAYIDDGTAGAEVVYADGTREPLREQCVAGRSSGK
jgi:hypothetical protein